MRQLDRHIDRPTDRQVDRGGGVIWVSDEDMCASDGAPNCLGYTTFLDKLQYNFQNPNRYYVQVGIRVKGNSEP